MTRKVGGFEGQTTGTTPTSTNSDDFGDNAMSAGQIVTTGGVVQYSTARAMHGTVSMLVTQNAANVAVFGYTATPDADADSITIRFYIYIVTLPSTLSQFGTQVRNSASGGIIRTDIGASGQVRLNLGATANVVSTTPNFLATATWYRVEIQASALNTAGAAQAHLQVYAGDATTALWSLDITGATVGSLANHIRFGALSTTNSAISANFDDVAFEVGVATAIGGTLSSVTSDTDLRWKVSQQVTSDSDLRWRLSNGMVSDLNLPWGVRGIVTSDSTQSWRVRQIATSDSDLRWQVSGRVNSDSDLRWQVAGKVNSDSDIRWRVSQRLTSDSDLRWRLRSVVSADMDLQWIVSSRVVADLDLRFALRNLVTHDDDIRWAVRTSVTSDSNLQWKVREVDPVASTSDLRWIVRNRVLVDADLRWIVFNPAQRAGFEGQTDGVTPTVGNSDDFGDAQITSIANTGGTLTYSTTDAAHGSRSLLLTNTAAATQYVVYSVDTGFDSGRARFYMKILTAPTAAVQIGAQTRSAAGGLARTQLSGAAMRLQFVMNPGTATAATGDAFVLDTWYRIEYEVTGTNGTSGAGVCRAYLGDQTTPLFTLPLTAQTPGGTVDNFRLGKFDGTNVGVVARFDDTFFEPGISTPAGPVLASTPITSDVDLRWVVKQGITSDLNLQYAIVNVTTQSMLTLELPPRLEGFVSSLDGRVRIYRAPIVLPTPVYSDVDLQWALLAGVASDADLRWAVDNVIASALSVSWLVSQRVASDISMPWGVRNQVASDSDLRWQVRTTATSDVDLRWALRGRVSSDVDLRFGVRTTVAVDTDLRWALRSVVTTTLDLRYAVDALATSDSDLRWVVFATTPVSSTLDARWAVLPLPGTDPVSTTLDLRYAVRQRVASDLESTWAALLQVTADASLRWAVQAVAATQADLRWAVGTGLASDVDLRYAIRNQVASDVDNRWAVRSVVTSDTNLRWATREIVSSTVQLDWPVRARIDSDLDTRWQVIGRIESMMTLSWVVSGAIYYVAADTLLSWAVRQGVTDTVDLQWLVTDHVQSDVRFLWSLGFVARDVQVEAVLAEQTRIIATLGEQIDA
jgi:hypothetical protein